MSDVLTVLASSTSLNYIKNAGGFITVQRMEELPLQQKHPTVALKDGGSDPTHYSSRVKWIPFKLEVICTSKIHNQYKKVKGDSNWAKPALQVATDVRGVLDLNRIDLKYARVVWTEDRELEILNELENEFLVAKTMVFEYIRIEP